MKLFRVLVLGVALVAGGIAAYLALNIGPAAAPSPTVVELAPSIQSQDVLVASADIGQGHKLTAANVRWQRWPDEAINASYIQKQSAPDAMEKLQGSIVRSQFVAGEPIRESKLARPGSGFLAALLPQGKRAIAVRVSAQNTAGGFILPNDRVDVVQTISQQAGPEAASVSVSRTILTNVKVLAIDQSVEQVGGGAAVEGEEGGETGGEAVVVGKTATLELNPLQVELITAAETSGTLSLALRSIEDASDATATLAPEDKTVVTTPPPAERTSSTVRVFRGGRVQETTIGVVPAEVAPPPSAPSPPAAETPEARCTESAKEEGAFSSAAFIDCMEQAASTNEQG